MRIAYDTSASPEQRQHIVQIEYLRSKPCLKALHIMYIIGIIWWLRIPSLRQKNPQGFCPVDFFIECTRFEPTASFAARTNVRDQGFSPSASCGRCSEGGKLAAVKIARRSKPQKRFWAPQVYAMGSSSLLR